MVRITLKVESGGYFPISMEESRGAEGEEHHGQNSTAEVTTNTVYTILQQQQQHPPNPYRNCYIHAIIVITLKPISNRITKVV
jgi:hypothetical protein